MMHEEKKENYFTAIFTTLAGMHTKVLEKNHSQKVLELRYLVHSTLRNTVIVHHQKHQYHRYFFSKASNIN